MRSLLFVPGDSPRGLDVGRQSGADVLILDVADLVAAGRKDETRRLVAGFSGALGDRPILFVRIHKLASSLAEEDLAAVMPAHPTGIVLPEVERGADVALLSVKLRVHEAENGIDDGATRILPVLAGTVGSFFSTGMMAIASGRICGIGWDAETLATKIGAQSVRDSAGTYTGAFSLARSATLLAASTLGVPAIDTLCPMTQHLEKDCAEATRDGFTAKFASHPAQVPIIKNTETRAHTAGLG